ncbi:hypothetical protein [Sphingomonas hankookensis]|uniref:hypothetical protein n=1 Tax=Sphingomonas hankookensis TaxID=563996 RepID=UPI003D3026DC
MNGGLLIGAAAVVVPIAVIEVRRKVGDWRRATRPDADTVWSGLDTGSGDFTVWHDGGSYTAVSDASPGNAGDFSPCDTGCDGGGA